MPAPLLRELKSLIGASNVLHKLEDLVLYEYDGSVEKGRPDLVEIGRASCRERV